MPEKDFKRNDTIPSQNNWITPPIIISFAEHLARSDWREVGWSLLWKDPLPGLQWIKASLKTLTISNFDGLSVYIPNCMTIEHGSLVNERTNLFVLRCVVSSLLNANNKTTTQKKHTIPLIPPISSQSHYHKQCDSSPLPVAKFAPLPPSQSHQTSFRVPYTTIPPPLARPGGSAGWLPWGWRCPSAAWGSLPWLPATSSASQDDLKAWRQRPSRASRSPSPHQPGGGFRPWFVLKKMDVWWRYIRVCIYIERERYIYDHLYKYYVYV